MILTPGEYLGPCQTSIIENSLQLANEALHKWLIMFENMPLNPKDSESSDSVLIWFVN